MTVVRMGNFHVSIKEEDEATLKKLSKDVAYSRLAGGFQQYAQGQAMLGAAEGMAKGGEGSGAGAGLQGMGMGMGFGMAQMFTNQQQQNQQHHQQQQQPAAAAAPADTRTPAQRLKELKELKDAGVLSDDEYNAKRAELMKLL
jgi:membrane protease subunit (stomatin/prohibitin family)